MRVKAYSLKIFTSYEFTISIFVNNQEATEKLLVFVTGFDMPQLNVSIPAIYRVREVNPNTLIFANIRYKKNHTISYACDLNYKYKLEKVIIFNFNRVKFKIWDHFNNFTDDNKLSVKFKVWDPYQSMPFTYTFDFQVNFPPQNCSFNVTPTKGTSLSTKFKLKVENCSDNDMPLHYQFYFY